MKLRSKYFVIVSLISVVSLSALFFFYYSNYYSNFSGQTLPPPEEYTFSLAVSDKRDVERGHASKGGNMLLTLGTKREYGCASYFIMLENIIEDNIVKIKILGIGHPNDWCLEAIRPASAIIDLGRARSFELSFVLGDRKDVYRVIFESGSFSVNPIDSLFGFFTTYAR